MQETDENEGRGTPCTETPRLQRHLRIVHSDNKPASGPIGIVPPNSKRTAMLDMGSQARIGIALRAAFDDIAKAPMPDRIVALLEALETKKGQQDR